MCFSYRSNKNPQTVKLSPGSSENQPRGQLPYRADMLRSRRRCAQTARISLHQFNCQRAIKRQNFTGRRFPGVSPLVLSSDFPARRIGFRVRFDPSPSLVRFGEAVFTEAGPEPQEEKRRLSHFFRKPRKMHKIRWLAEALLPIQPKGRNFVAGSAAKSGRFRPVAGAVGGCGWPATPAAPPPPRSKAAVWSRSP